MHTQTKINIANLKVTWSARHIHIFLKVSLKIENIKYYINCAQPEHIED